MIGDYGTDSRSAQLVVPTECEKPWPARTDQPAGGQTAFFAHPHGRPGGEAGKEKFRFQ